VPGVCGLRVELLEHAYRCRRGGHARNAHFLRTAVGVLPCVGVGGDRRIEHGTVEVTGRIVLEPPSVRFLRRGEVGATQSTCNLAAAPGAAAPLRVCCATDESLAHVALKVADDLDGAIAIPDAVAAVAGGDRARVRLGASHELDADGGVVPVHTAALVRLARRAEVHSLAGRDGLALGFSGLTIAVRASVEMLDENDVKRGRRFWQTTLADLIMPSLLTAIILRCPSCVATVKSAATPVVLRTIALESCCCTNCRARRPARSRHVRWASAPALAGLDAAVPRILRVANWTAEGLALRHMLRVHIWRSARSLCRSMGRLEGRLVGGRRQCSWYLSRHRRGFGSDGYGCAQVYKRLQYESVHFHSIGLPRACTRHILDGSLAGRNALLIRNVASVEHV